MRPWETSRTEPVGNMRPPSRSAHAAALTAPGFTLMSRAASLRLALPAQHGGRHRPGERPIACLHGCHLRAGRAYRQHLLQGLLVDQHAGNEVHRERARREPRWDTSTARLSLLEHWLKMAGRGR